jgi:hypothetical protein
MTSSATARPARQSQAFAGDSIGVPAARPGPARPARTSPQRTQEIRDWARASGYTVSNRGRIAADIVTAYDKTH